MKTIAIVMAKGSALSEHLVAAIDNLYDLRCELTDRIDRKRYEAAVLVGLSQREIADTVPNGLPCLAFVGTEKPSVQCPEGDVSLANTPHLAQPFRGRRLADKGVQSIALLEERPTDEVIARKGGNAVWLHRRCGNSEVDLVAFDPPAITAKHRMFEYLRKHDCVRLLPILHFARKVSGWELPPPRAALMFDDPNLHWRSYGHVNYRDLVEDACRHNYHACFATVPMDSWYVHESTADLFRKNRSRVSLLIHGNDHTYFELTNVTSRGKQEALVAQALSRIERLERLSGLDVPRVMAPPHGGCNHGMANVLMRAGFEAACISTSSLIKRNPNASWDGTIGLNPAEFFGGGLPIIPRYNIRWDETYPLFAAFLGQPIIPVGHHDDARTDLDLVRQCANLINSVGDVQWMDMKSIARSNFSLRREAEVLCVKMHSRKIRLRVPESCKQLRFHRPWLNGDGEEALELAEAGSVGAKIESYHGELIPVKEGTDIDVASISPNKIDHRTVRTSRSPLWAVARRQLCEARDRLRPAVDGLFGSRRMRNNERRGGIPGAESNSFATE